LVHLLGAHEEDWVLMMIRILVAREEDKNKKNEWRR
jgi:hypothetical protein